MFEKLITDFKRSLPESLRKKMGIEVDEPASLDEDEDDEESDVENDVEEKKKNQNSMIIKVIVVLGLGYFALDEFVLNKEGETPQVEVKELKRKNAKPLVEKKTETPPTTMAEPPTVQAQAPEEVPPKSAEQPVEETPVPTPTPTETIAEAEHIPPPSEPTPAPTEAVVEEEKKLPEAPIENINIISKDETIKEPPETTGETVSSKTGEVKTPEASIDKNIDQMIDKIDSEEGQKGLAGLSKNELDAKFVEEVVETPAPPYDQVGRGLVYNCKDKYWACVDKPSYVTCNKNMKWNKSKGYSAECIVKDVYNSEEDCAKIQKYNVSTSQPTDFCQ